MSDSVGFGLGEELEPELHHVPPQPRPLFCLNCKRSRRSDAELCPECGDRLIGQAYCAVCEDYWKLEVGALCPKHDLELTASPPTSAARFHANEAINWTTVQAYTRHFEAEAARLRLDAEGIPVMIDGSRLGAEGNTYHAAFGVVRVKVPAKLVQESRVLLTQTWAIPSDPDGLDEDWEEPELPNALDPIEDDSGPNSSLWFWFGLLVVVSILTTILTFLTTQ